MTKEDTLLLIQIDGQTNWTMNEPDLNQTKIGEYMGTVKNGLPHGQGQLCYLHGGKYIGSWKIYWFLERWGKRWFREIYIN